MVAAGSTVATDRACTVSGRVAMHPVTAAWHAAGRPAPDFTPRKRGGTPSTKRPPEPFDGTCALTGERGPIWPATPWVVSDNFGDWDRCPFRHRPPLGFCSAAALAFRTPSLQYRPHVLDGGFREVDAAELRGALSRPLPPDQVVTIPVSQHKHLLHFAPWGQVTTDGRSLAWGEAECHRLDVLAELRSLGFGEAVLALPAPPWPLLRRLDADEMRRPLSTWGDLDPWRADRAYLTVALLATRKPKEGA